MDLPGMARFAISCAVIDNRAPLAWLLVPALANASKTSNFTRATIAVGMWLPVMMAMASILPCSSSEVLVATTELGVLFCHPAILCCYDTRRWPGFPHTLPYCNQRHNLTLWISDKQIPRSLCTEKSGLDLIRMLHVKSGSIYLGIMATKISNKTVAVYNETVTVCNVRAGRKSGTMSNQIVCSDHRAFRRPCFNLRHLQRAMFWLENPGPRSLFESGLGSTLVYYVTCFSKFLCSGIKISTKGHFIGHEARLRAGPVLKHSAPLPAHLHEHQCWTYLLCSKMEFVFFEIQLYGCESILYTCCETLRSTGSHLLSQSDIWTWPSFEG